jgi:hypothetical protein
MILTPTDNVTEQSIEDFMVTFSDVVKSKDERYALVIDLRQRSSMSRKQRKFHIDELNKNKEFAKEFNAGTALIVNSAVVRGIMMSVFWFYNPKHPTDVFKTMEDAFDWANSQVRPTFRLTSPDYGA